MAKRIVAIIQARMGSSRLPGKILLPIQGRPVIGHIHDRLNRVGSIDEVVIATSNEIQDDQVAHYCENENLSCFRGNEIDVLDRFYHAAINFEAQIVIRVTGDCPLLDPLTINKLIDMYRLGNFDHCGVAAGAGVANDTSIQRYPDGLDAEIFGIEILREAWVNSTSKQHREHVTPFIWQQEERYSLGKLECESGDFSAYRWTLDNAEDFQLIKKIYDELYPRNPFFGMQDVLLLLKAHPEWSNENKHLIGSEGYEEFWN
jgi:spore coat polysaccharide biosynthesis protein SpsF